MAKELYLLRDNVNILTSPVTPINDFTVVVGNMGDNVLSCKFSYPEKIDFNFKEYVEYEREGEFDVDDSNKIERYYLKEAPTWEKNEKSLMLEYNANLVAKSEILKYIPMIDSWETFEVGVPAQKPSLIQTNYSFFGGAYEYFQNIKASMISEFGYNSTLKQPNGWVIVLNITNDYKKKLPDNTYVNLVEDMLVTVSNSTVFAALQDLYTKFQIPFSINGNNILVGGNKTYVSTMQEIDGLFERVPHIFRYGKGNGLYKLTKAAVDNDIITKIRGIGSERNIPFDYLQKEKKDAGLTALPMTNLMPKVFRDTLIVAKATSNPLAVKDYYINELKYDSNFPQMSFETFDDIYPTIKGLSLAGERIDKITGVYYEASSVSAENATEMTGDNQKVLNPYFWLKIPKLDFDLTKHFNEKEKPVIEMTSGACGACKFEIVGVGTPNDSWGAYEKKPEAGLLIEYPKQTIGMEQPNTSKESIYYEFPKVVEMKELVIEDGLQLQYSIVYDYLMHIQLTDFVNAVQHKVELVCEREGYASFTIKSASKEITSSPPTPATTKYEESTGTLTGTYLFPPTPNGSAKYKFWIRLAVKVNRNNAVASQRNQNYAGKSLITLNNGAMVIKKQEGSVETNTNKTNEKSTWLYVKKDLDSFNTLMPYLIDPMWDTFDSPLKWDEKLSNYIKPNGLTPKAGDEYIFTGVSLPEWYVIAAELKLENKLKTILAAKADFRYSYECGFDEKFLAENPTLNSQMKAGNIVRVFDETDVTIQTPTYISGSPDKRFADVTLNSVTLKYKPDKSISTTE